MLHILLTVLALLIGGCESTRDSDGGNFAHACKVHDSEEVSCNLFRQSGLDCVWKQPTPQPSRTPTEDPSKKPSEQPTTHPTTPVNAAVGDCSATRISSQGEAIAVLIDDVSHVNTRLNGLAEEDQRITDYVQDVEDACASANAVPTIEEHVALEERVKQLEEMLKDGLAALARDYAPLDHDHDGEYAGKGEIDSFRQAHQDFEDSHYAPLDHNHDGEYVGKGDECTVNPYFGHDLGTNECPEGSRRIETDAECQEAAKLGGTWGSTSSWGSDPRGCFINTSNYFRFNTHWVGSTNGNYAPVCARECGPSEG